MAIEAKFQVNIVIICHESNLDLLAEIMGDISNCFSHVVEVTATNATGCVQNKEHIVYICCFATTDFMRSSKTNVVSFPYKRKGFHIRILGKQFWRLLILFFNKCCFFKF